MPVLLYLHGFLSSPLSEKAVITQNWLAQHYPDWQFACPELSARPSEAKVQLHQWLSTQAPQSLYIVGSSLGGFWATDIAERFARPAVLINPAVAPQERFKHLVGTPVKNYHTQQPSQLEPNDLSTLADCFHPSIAHPHLYWLMVQTGDTTLDYRQAVHYYAGCRQMVEPGGHHSFAGYADWLPEIMAFFKGF